MTPYRTAEPVPASRALVVLCAACGVTARASTSDETFRCGACERVQPVLRTEAELDAASATAVRRVAGAYPELEPFTKSLGVDVSCAMVTVKIGGLECDVSLRTNSGVVCGIELAIAVTGLPSIELRREMSKDVRAKEAGIEREVQTGDDEFDRTVYVSSDAAPEDVAIVLSSPAVRAAVVRLVDEFGEVNLTGTAVATKRDIERGVPLDPKRTLAAAAALRVVAGAPRPASTTRVRWLPAHVAIVVVGLMIGPSVVATVLGGHFFFPVAMSLFLYGLGGGLLGGLAMAPLWVRLLRGRSNSRRDIAFAWMATLLCLPFLVTAVLVLANGARDRSPERVYELDVVSMSYDDESDKSHAEAKGRVPELGSGTHSYYFPDKAKRAKTPAVVRVGLKSGALGFVWQSSPAELRFDDVVLTED